MERVFSEAEATALLPRLTELLTALRAAHERVLEHGPGGHGRSVASNGSAASAVAASSAANEASALVTEIEGSGVIIRDPESGLVDFAAVRDGEPVYLCWRLGEPRIAYWHPRDAGFMGRLPL